MAEVYSCLKALLGIAAAWIGWFIHRFILMRHLNSDEPEELPYLMPVVGHMFSMATGAHRLFDRGKKYFGSSPWTLTIMGESIYIVNSPEDVIAVYKASKALDFDPFIKDMLSKYGLPRPIVEKMFTNQGGSSKNWMDVSIENFKHQLHPGKKLEALQKGILESINQALTWDNINGRMVIRMEGDAKIVSLWEWCLTVIVDAQTRAFFDSAIYQTCPDLLSRYQIYEKEAWKLPLDLPPFLTRTLRSTQKHIVDGFANYLRLPQNDRPSESWIIKELCDSLRVLGLDESQQALNLFMTYRLFNANAFKLVFWVLCYVLFDKNLMQELKDETEPAFADGLSPNLGYLFESCHLLHSTCEEALRHTVWSMGARTVASECIIGGKRLKAGRKLLMPYRTMHFEPSVFGHHPEKFDPRRFLNNSGLIKSPSYRPFGGAAHYCPGRFLARREVQMFVAVLLRRFDMQVESEAGDKQGFPKMDDTLPSGGIQDPAKGSNLLLRVVAV